MDDGSATAQSVVDARNTAFWEELCGTGLAQALGITSKDPQALNQFDAGYFAMYPYLKQYVDRFPVSGKRILEVGLGYGTLSQYITERGADYQGLDIAEVPWKWCATGWQCSESRFARSSKDRFSPHPSTMASSTWSTRSDASTTRETFRELSAKCTGYSGPAVRLW